MCYLNVKILYGIVNGIDKNVWNPEKDKLIPAKYSAKNIEAKLIIRKILLKVLVYHLMKMFLLLDLFLDFTMLKDLI